MFSRARVAVFVDGCFWHGCPVHHTVAKAHAEYWRDKVERNAARDLETTWALEAAGWKVLRFWEHEEPSEVADRICAEVARRREGVPGASPSAKLAGEIEPAAD